MDKLQLKWEWDDCKLRIYKDDECIAFWRMDELANLACRQLDFKNYELVDK